MNVVFCDKRECVFCDVDGICNCVMHDGTPYCKSESIDTKNDAADGLREENAKLRELARDLRFCARQSNCLKCEHGRFCDLRLDERCKELGIEVKE